MRQAPKGGACLPVAFFDLDRTLIDGYAYTRLLKRLWRAKVRRAGLVRLLLRLLLSRLTPHTPLSSWWPGAFARYLRGLEPEALAHLTRASARDVAKDVRPAMRDALAAERGRGARLWLVSATVDLLAEAVAQELGFDACVCTRLALALGRYGGSLEGPVCRGREKLRRVEEEMAARGTVTAWSACSYYADGYEDLPLLEAVGRPVVVHPDERLMAVAKERGYACLGVARSHRAGG